MWLTYFVHFLHENAFLPCCTRCYLENLSWHDVPIKVPLWHSLDLYILVQLTFSEVSSDSRSLDSMFTEKIMRCSILLVWYALLKTFDRSQAWSIFYILVLKVLIENSTTSVEKKVKHFLDRNIRHFKILFTYQNRIASVLPISFSHWLYTLCIPFLHKTTIFNKIYRTDIRISSVHCESVVSFIKFTREVKITSIFYSNIIHGSSSSLCIRANHGTVLEISFSLFSVCESH